MVKTSNIKEKEQWIANRLVQFYGDSFNLEQLQECINNSNTGIRKIRLRVIEWFITNYAKKHNISYPITRPNGTTEHFRVYLNYRAQISSYPKKLFDPYCRGDIIIFEINSTRIETAICQLHFFKWAIENLLLKYIEQNYDEIYEDMQQNSTKPNINPIKKTKRHLSESIHQKIVCSNNPVKLTF